jgi:hypothetical protein
MIFESNATDRGLYNNARQAMIDAKISAIAYDNAVKTACILRLIQPIITGNQIISFPVLTSQQGASGVTRPDEVRLPQQNAFFVGQMYFTIFKQAPGLYNYTPNTYPNAVTYTNAQSLYGVYNGRLNLVIDGSVIARAYAMSKFLNIPQTQLTAATNSPQDQFDGTALLPWEPNVVFVGTSDIVLNVLTPAALGTIDANTFGCWTFYGIEAQNVALGAITN